MVWYVSLSMFHDTIQGQYLAHLKGYCHSLPAILSAHATPNQSSKPAAHSQQSGPVFKPQPLVHCQIVPLCHARLSSTGFQFACLLLTSPVLDPVLSVWSLVNLPAFCPWPRVSTRSLLNFSSTYVPPWRTTLRVPINVVGLLEYKSVRWCCRSLHPYFWHLLSISVHCWI